MKLYDRCKAYRESIGAPWFYKPWDLNLVIVRSGKVGVWDDWAILCCLDDAGREVVQRVRATGDAWEGEWIDPTHPDGCIYVLDQYVPGGLELGEFKGRAAFRQRKPFLYVRWVPDGTVPTVKQLEERAEAGHSFSANRGTHWHNRHNGKSPGKPERDDTEGCTLSLHQHQHSAAIQLGNQQLKYRGSSIVSPAYCKYEDFRGADLT